MCLRLSMRRLSCDDSLIPGTYTMKKTANPLRANLMGHVTCLVTCLSLLVIAPAFSTENPFRDLVDTQGEFASLDGTFGNGKWTLVMIWATDCHICKEQKPKISAFHDKHKDSLVEVFGIALDGASHLDDVNQYLEEHQPTFPNYVGELPIVASNYTSLTEEPLRGTPTYLLFNPQGELKGNNPGPVSPSAIEGFIERHTNK